MTTYRAKVARLRGILEEVRQEISASVALGLGDLQAFGPLEELIPEIDEILKETADKHGEDLHPRLPWREGYVAQFGEYVKVYEGQAWELADNGAQVQGEIIQLFVSHCGATNVATGAPYGDGSVNLRVRTKEDFAKARKIYPDREFAKGEKDPCPFKFVRNGKFRGSLICHEGWDIWSKLVPVPSMDVGPVGYSLADDDEEGTLH